MIAKKSTTKQHDPPVPIVEVVTCAACDYVCYSQFHLAQHTETHEKPPKSDDLPYTCRMCPYATDKLSYYKAHLLHHPGRHVLRVYRCQRCEFASCTESITEEHVDQKHPDGGYEVKRDVLQHDQSPPKCNLCGEEFPFNAVLLQHIKAAHGTKAEKEQKKAANMDDDYDFQKFKFSLIDPQVSQPREEAGTGEIYKYHCDNCDFETNDLGEYKAHDHNMDVDAREQSMGYSASTPTATASNAKEYVKQYKCNICAFHTPSQASFSQHKATHTK